MISKFISKLNILFTLFAYLVKTSLEIFTAKYLSGFSKFFGHKIIEIDCFRIAVQKRNAIKTFKEVLEIVNLSLPHTYYCLKFTTQAVFDSPLYSMYIYLSLRLSCQKNTCKTKNKKLQLNPI